MATMYVAWHAQPMAAVGGTTLPIEGEFISSQAVDISAGGATTEAPAGAYYAEIWADVPFYYGKVAGNTAAAKTAGFKPWMATVPLQIAGLADLGTKIAGIAI